MRAGFVALCGRPNAGKSTLVNAIVGTKVAIVSDKPQTTRRAIRGVATMPDCQLVLVDLPGIQRPRDALTERMARRVERSVGDADTAVLVLNGEQRIGGGDRYLARALSEAGLPVIVALNKIDRLDSARTAAALAAAATLGVGEEFFPISARTGRGVRALTDALVARMPEGPALYDASTHSDLPEALELAELIREPILGRTRQELPHAIEVEVSEIEREGDELVRVRALIWVETESQKGIVIGSGGQMIKSIGTAARRELERHLQTRVHLELSVRVRRRWRTDEGLLDRLGIE